MGDPEPGQGDLDYLIFGFLSSLPQTIRNDILLFVVMYAGAAAAAEIECNPLQDYLELMREFLLRQKSEIETVGAVLRTVGVLDFVIPRAAGKAARAGAIATKLADRFPQAEKIRLGARRYGSDILIKHWPIGWIFEPAQYRFARFRILKIVI